MAGEPPPSRSRTVVKAVVFDVGGVLFSPPQTSIAEVERELELPFGTLARAFVSGEPNNAFCQLERGELTLSQFLPVFERDVEREARSAGAAAVVSGGFSARQLFQRMASSVRPVPAMFRAVEIIKQAGYKTGVITNNWIDDITDQTNQLMSEFLSRYFDIVLQSCQLGIRKPHPLIYRLACHRLAVEPSQVVYLDDLGGNVRGAREVGMTAVRVRETEQALRELETLLGGVRLVDGAPQTGGLRLVDGAPQTEDSDRDNMIKSLL